MEQHLKEIAKELKLIRKELQLDNDLHLEERAERIESRTPKHRQNITDRLNKMFK